MAKEPRRIEPNTVVYFVNDLGSTVEYQVIAQRGSTLTVHRQRGRIELPDRSFEPMVQEKQIEANEVDFGHDWYSDEWKAVIRSIRTMKNILTYAEYLRKQSLTPVGHRRFACPGSVGGSSSSEW